MKPLRYVGTDEPLSTEQGQYIRQQVVIAARRTLVGRKLLPIRKIDSGAQTFSRDAMTEVSNALIDLGWPGRQTLDITNLTRTTVAIPTIHHEFEINKLDLLSSQLTGSPLNTQLAESAGYKVSLLEDALIIEGYARIAGTYEINGLYNGAGNTDAADLPWATEANIATSIQNGVALLLADNINPPYNLTVNPTEYVYMLDNIANTGISYYNWVKDVIKGEIFITSSMTAGNAMLTKANPVGMFEYVVAEDFNVETQVEDKRHGEGLFGRAYVRGLPVIYDSNAICSLSAIESP